MKKGRKTGGKKNSSRVLGNPTAVEERPMGVDTSKRPSRGEDQIGLWGRGEKVPVVKVEKEVFHQDFLMVS